MEQKATAGRGQSIARRMFATLLLLIGLALTWLGGELIWLGGSFYYVITGIAVIASAILTWRGDRRGAWLYGLMLAGTLVWSLWEAGLDGWALMARLVGPTVLGLIFLTPISRAGPSKISAPIGLRTAAALSGVVAFSIAAGLTAHFAIGGPSIAAERMLNTRTGADGDWPIYGRDQSGQRYSPLADITPENVGRLERLWTFRTGFDSANTRSPFEATPLKIADSLYLCTPASEVIALDAETGAARWRFNPHADREQVAFAACRGVSYFKDPAAAPGEICAERIISTTVDGRLLSLDARNGKLCSGFGENGQVDLKRGLGKVEKGYYYVTSAPLVMRGKIVLGGFVPDNQHLLQPSGVIRAFDAVTGKLAWAFDVGRPGERGEPRPGETYTHDTPNSWAPISGDEKLGMVYLPTGNAAPDWYGGQRRPFDDRYSSAIVALDIDTGEERWVFQTTHHDLWDYDVPAQPVLYDMPAAGGGRVPALIQATKRGQIFVLNRQTGKPISKVVERAVPQSVVPGERSSPTQPYSVGMPDFAGPRLTERMMWGLTPIDQAWCRIEFRKSRYQGDMTPPATNGMTLVYPGYQGGSDWGGVSIDPRHDILVGNSSRMAMRTRLIPRREADARGIKPMGEKGQGDPGGASAQAGTPYAIDIIPFLSPLQVPCQQPPYGMISAIDMKTRRLMWSMPFGEARDSGPWGVPSMLPLTMGVPNTGGSVVTASGLVFIGATQERAFRAFDIRTGRELWKDRLPAGAQATPMTYRSPGGRQVVVIAAGGHLPIQAKAGDYLIAYALPDHR